jgi:ribonuclease P/MRP protein subunit RPP40
MTKNYWPRWFIPKLKLQADLDKIMAWCNKWQMYLNSSKCKIMHIGKKNPQLTYTKANPNGSISMLESTTCETSDLKLSTHVNNVVSKANQALGMMKNPFSYFDEDMLRRLYTAFFRPNLDMQ